MALAVAEIVLRVVPVPGIEYHSFYYDELTGGHLHPNSKKIYRRARNETIEREVNEWGYLDVHHTRERPRGTLRIGFFGDSYTEAQQVPIEDTFFRLVENDLNHRLSTGALSLTTGRGTAERVETLAFGISGRSTIQSYLECSRWMNAVALDYVVYVFCENDISDQIREMKASNAIPYAYLEGDSFVVDNAFRDLYNHKKSRLHRSWQYLKARSLVVSTLETRLKLLKRHGLKLRATPEDRHMVAGPGPDGRAATGTAPSTWRSDSLLTYGKTLAVRIMDKWRSDVVTSGREFVIIYVPKERLIHKPIDEQDSWAGWLHEYCNSRGITLVDPSRQLVSRRDGGEEVYYDHFTSAGHRAVADAFLERFLQ